MGWICAATGRDAEGRKLLEEAQQQETESLQLAPHDPRHLYSMAATTAAWGKLEAALDFLKQAVETGWVDRRFTEIDPRFDGLKQHPTFKSILAELELRVRQLRRQRPAVKLVSQN
jgi:hypothetical protein